MPHEARFNVRKSPHGEGVVIVDVIGELSEETDLAEFAGLVRDLVAQGRRRLVLNLAGTTFVNTRALGEFTQAHKRLRDRGGELKIAGANPDVWRVLEMIWLHRMITCYPDEKEAARAF